MSRTLSFASLLLLATLGCANSFSPALANNVSLTGNWQLSSASVSAARLNALSGQITGSGQAISGVVHSDSALACVAPSVAIVLNGAADSQGVVTLTGALAGGTLTITGIVAADGRSLSNASYTVTGGTCGFAAAATATAQAYTPISGTFAGTFLDAGVPAIAISATLQQTPAADTSGNFQLSGSATFPSNPCFSSPLPVTNTQVTGGSFTITYADAALGNSVTASGTFSVDGKTLTVANWTTTGTCGPDSGTGSLARQ